MNTYEVDAKEYWQFHVTSMEGAWLLQKLGKQFPSKDPTAMIMGSNGQCPVVLMKKSVFTPEAINKVLGIPVEKLIANTGPIKVGTKAVPGLPEPTVSGYGEA